MANPDLSVWMITGDGDSLAIGGNHFIHLLRRNLDINVVLFNNEIYGLTKGQFSPTSLIGQKTKSSPYGNTQPPFHPGELALGAQARFFARLGGNSPKEMTELFIEAQKFKGTSLIEILQNCVIFNDGCFTQYTDKSLVLNGLKLEVVTIGENGISEEDILVHDAKCEDNTLHQMLVKLQYPLVTGIIRSFEDELFEEREARLNEEVRKKANFSSVDELFLSGETYEVK